MPQKSIAIVAAVFSISSALSPIAVWADGSEGGMGDASAVSAVSGKLVRTAPASEGLTASSLIKSDIDFYFKELQDMSYVLKQCDQIIDNRDYDSIRGILRQEPLRTLRKTSKSLQKFLPSKELQDQYQGYYSKMIDAVDDLDFLATTRVRKEGLPKEGVKDTKIFEVLDKAVSNLESMLALVPR